MSQRSLVVVGNERRMTAAMCVWILESAGLEPGYRLSTGSRPVPTKRKIIGGGAKPAPFVIELGQEEEFTSGSSDDCALVSSTEGNLEKLVQSIPGEGLMACAAIDHAAAKVVNAHSRTSFYALESDAVDVTPTWLGMLAPFDSGSSAQPFDLFIGGSSCGRFALKLGADGADASRMVRNAIGAIAVCAEGLGVDVERARRAIATFSADP